MSYLVYARKYRPMSFGEMIDPETNRTRVRKVDIDSDSYRVARAYMIRLETADLEDPVMLAKLAAAARCTEQDLVNRYRRAATRISRMPDGTLNIDLPNVADAGGMAEPSRAASKS